MNDGGEEAQSGPSLAETARDYFVKASVKCPASTVGQGAFIAFSCKTHGLDPSQLKESLFSDNEQLKKIVEAATKSHNTHPETLSPKHIDKSRVRSVVARDYNIAEALMPLEIDVLNQLCGEKHDEVRTKALGNYPNNNPTDVINRMNYIDDELEREANKHLWKIGAHAIT